MKTEKEQNQQKKAGRKPKDDPAVHRYGFKLTGEENARFNTLFLKSGLDEKTRYIKAVLLGTEIKVVTIDKAGMDYYIRLTNFYAQFQATGNNYNQTVRAIKSNFSEKRALALLYKLEKTTLELILLSRQIIELTKEYEKKWLQK